MPRHAALSAAAVLLLAIAWTAAADVQSGVYELTVHTVMPHLEENLRYATIREVRCLRSHELAAAFPVLRHPALHGCKLTDERRDTESVRYRLACDKAEVATGSARWDALRDRIVGALEIKMGGKNMTFTQWIEGKRQSACPAE